MSLVQFVLTQLKSPLRWVYSIVLLEMCSVLIGVVSPASGSFLGFTQTVSKNVWTPFGYLYPYGVSALGITITSSFLVGIIATLIMMFVIAWISKRASGPFHYLVVLITVVVIEVMISDMQLRRGNYGWGHVDYWSAVQIYIPVLILSCFVVQYILNIQSVIKNIEKVYIWEEIQLRENSSAGNNPRAASGQIQPRTENDSAGDNSEQANAITTSPTPRYCPYCGRQSVFRRSNGRLYSSCCGLPVDRLPSNSSCVVCGEKLATAGNFCGACGKIRDIELARDSESETGW